MDSNRSIGFLSSPLTLPLSLSIFTVTLFRRTLSSLLPMIIWHYLNIIWIRFALPGHSDWIRAYFLRKNAVGPIRPAFINATHFTAVNHYNFCNLEPCC